MVKMRRRSCCALFGVSIVLVAVGVGLYFILRPSAKDPTIEEGVSFRIASEYILISI